jgi:hypothetical protein
MADTLTARISVPDEAFGQDLPYVKDERTDPTGEIKARSATSLAKVPFKFKCGKATMWISPKGGYVDGKLNIYAYDVSVSVPGAVCGLNALLENAVYEVSLFALYFFQYWLLECGVATETVKKFTMKNVELEELHLTYLIYSGNKNKANNRILELAQRGLTLFSGDMIKKNKRKAAVEYRNSDLNCYVRISKSSKFDIAAYVKSFVIPKSFCGLPTVVSDKIFAISQNYVRFEVKLKKAWFSETVVVEDAEGKKVKKKQLSKWASPLSWKGRAGKAMYEQVFEEARDLLRLNEKFNQRRHRPDFMQTLSDEHRAILEEHYAGTERVQSLLSRRPKNAKWTNCRLVFSNLSQFFHNRLFFSSQAKLRSTIQRLGITLNVCSSLRLAICTATCPPRMSWTPWANGRPT